jgi:hypothetical protein
MSPRLVKGAVCGLAVIALGVGGYVVGAGSGEDLDRARADGAAAGREHGAARGRERARAEGIERGRDQGYETGYETAYRRAYRAQFEEAGLEPPNHVRLAGGRGK